MLNVSENALPCCRDQLGGCLKSSVNGAVDKMRAMHSDEGSRGIMDGSSRATYSDIVTLLERRHRQFLEAVTLELEANGVHDINSVQAMILYNVGNVDIAMAVGELTLRGCYLGSNVSYNLKKLVTNGYILQERSPHDRRSIRIRLSDKGLQMRDKLVALYQRHVSSPSRHGAPSDEELVRTNEILRRLERFWSQSVEIGSRGLGLSSGD